MSIRQFFFSFISLFFVFLFVQHAHAATTVKRGPQTLNTKYITWTVSGGTGNCNGTVPGYEGSFGDGITAAWVTSHPSSGTMYLNQVNGNSSAGFPQVYTFYCTDGVNNDSDTLTVNDCDANEQWSSSLQRCGTCGNNATNYNTCNVCGNPSYPNWNGSSCLAACIAPAYWNGSTCTTDPVNAVCGGTAYTCSAGNYAGNGSLSDGSIGVNGAYSWTCNGTNGGSNANCNLACGAAIPIRTISWSPGSVTTGQSSTLTWTSSGASSCRWTRTKPVVGLQTDTGYTTSGGWFPNNGAGWSYGTVDPCDGSNSSCNGDTWTIQCKNSCNGYSAQASAALTVAPPDQVPIGWLDSVSSGGMAACGLASGWALDQDILSTSIGVHFYLDGAAGVGTRVPSSGEISTDVLRSDVNTIYGASGNHGYSYQLPNMMPGNHTLYAYAYSTVQQTSTPLLLPLGGVAFTCTGIPPTVDAGPNMDIVNPISTATVSGASASDSDGTLVSTVWNFVSGPGPTPTIVNGNTLTPTFNGMTTDGTYTFRLVATDNHNLTANDTMTVRRVTNGTCAPLHFSCTTGVSANNQTPANPGAGRDWTWDCNSINGGTNASCSETGYWLTTSITQTGGSAGTITPGPGSTLYASNTALTVTITPNGYVIPPTGASSALLSKNVDGTITTVNGSTPVPLTNNFTMSTDHSVSATLYRPDPITTTISSTSTYLGSSAILQWTTDGVYCDLYNFNGTVLIKSIGAVSTTTTNTATLTTADLPQTVGSFGYIMRCNDSYDVNRGLYDANVTINLWCPRDPVSYVGTPAMPGAPASCANAAPGGSISHTSGGLLLGPTQVKVATGQTVSFTSAASDATTDFNAHQLEWRHQESDGSWLWSWTAPSRGTVSYNNPDIFTEKDNNTITATFTPTAIGTYWVRFVMRDDMLNSPLHTPNLLYIVSPPNNRYYTDGGRLSYTSEFKVDVAGVGAEFVSNGSSLDWRCFGAEYVSLVGTKNLEPDHVVVPYRTILPFKNTPAYQFGLGNGSFTPQSGYSYTLLCETVDDSATAYYSSVAPTITANDMTMTSADIAWNCNTPLARGVTLEREYGMYPTSYQSTSTPSYVNTGLNPDTTYTYTLRCYDGWSGNGVSGRLLGTAQLMVTTDTNMDPTPIVIDAYIREELADPTTSTTATTTTGAFYDWHYEVTAGTPTSCTMQQRNDNGAWYPEPGYDTNTVGYTMRWADIFQADRTAFVNSYVQKHDWRITCQNAFGSITTKTWTLVKQQPSIPVIDTITEGANPPLADVTLHCSPAATTYSITHTTAPTQSGPGLGTIGAISWSPTVSGNYTITCDDGPPLVIFIDTTMFDPFFRLSGTQRTVGGTVSTILSWDISNPDNSCNLRAEVSTSSCANLAPGPQATCLNERTSAQNTINNNFLDETNASILTDVNDPSGQRSLSEALTAPGYLTPNARGKITITGVRYTTTFIGECSAGTPSRYRVSVVRENEG
ncbi:MAG: hypothetical protein QG653_335 [Patescibacteria group bacterium]|nr:hypothetical protein [Patescibacteria group bacterium]